MKSLAAETFRCYFFRKIPKKKFHRRCGKFSDISFLRYAAAAERNAVRRMLRKEFWKIVMLVVRSCPKPQPIRLRLKIRSRIGCGCGYQQKSRGNSVEFGCGCGCGFAKNDPEDWVMNFWILFVNLLALEVEFEKTEVEISSKVQVKILS